MCIFLKVSESISARLCSENHPIWCCLFSHVDVSAKQKTSTSTEESVHTKSQNTCVSCKLQPMECWPSSSSWLWRQGEKPSQDVSCPNAFSHMGLLWPFPRLLSYFLLFSKFTLSRLWLLIPFSFSFLSGKGISPKQGIPPPCY